MAHFRIGPPKERSCAEEREGNDMSGKVRREGGLSYILDPCLCVRGVQGLLRFSATCVRCLCNTLRHA
jgi:hypothetical protein